MVDKLISRGIGFCAQLMQFQNCGSNEWSYLRFKQFRNEKIFTNPNAFSKLLLLTKKFNLLKIKHNIFYNLSRVLEAKCM